MNSSLVSFGIDRARDYSVYLEVTSIIKPFQNTNNIFQAFQTKIKTIVTNDSIFKDLDDQVKRYIETFTSFDYLFSISRTSWGKLNINKLNKLKEINLRL